MRIVVVAAAMLSNLCGAASFDCQKADTAVERMVCSHPRLSKLDDEMAEVYSAVLTRATAPRFGTGLTRPTTPEGLRGEQRSWLATRDKCTDLACVTSAYLNRLNVLKSAIRIPQYDKSTSGAKSDDTRVIGIDCDEKTKTLEVGYFTEYNLPDKAMDLWDIFNLKTNSAPDERGNQHVLAVHEVVRKCTFNKTHYVVTIHAVPASWSLTGECGGETDGRAVIHRNGVKIFDSVFETCISKEIIAKIRIAEGQKKPSVIRMPFKDYYGYDK